MVKKNWRKGYVRPQYHLIGISERIKGGKTKVTKRNTISRRYNVRFPIQIHNLKYFTNRLFILIR